MKKLILLSLFLISIVSVFGLDVQTFSNQSIDLYTVSGQVSNQFNFFNYTGNNTYLSFTIPYNYSLRKVKLDQFGNSWISGGSAADAHFITRYTFKDGIPYTSKTWEMDNDTAGGLAIDWFGNVIVGSQNAEKIWVMQKESNFTTNFTRSTGSYPLSVIVDGNNDIWVAERLTDKVLRLFYSTNYTTNITYSACDQPRTLTVDKFNNIWLACFGNGVVNGRAIMYNASNNYSIDVNESIDRDTQTIITDFDGNVYVGSDDEGDSILVFLNRSDNYAKTTVSTAFDDIVNLALDTNNNIWVVSGLQGGGSGKFHFLNTSDSWNNTVTLSGGSRPRDAEAVNHLALLSPLFSIPNNAPIINTSQPANNTLTNSPIDVQITAIDENASVECSLYVDGVLNQTNSSVLNNTATTFVVGWLDGTHTWYVDCTDGTDNATSGLYNYYQDTVDPQIMSTLPLPFNTTIFSNYTMNIYGNATNDNLSNVSITISYPNATVFYANETTSFADVTKHLWNWVFNTTLEPNGNYEMYIYAEDNVANTKEQYITFSVDNCVPNFQCGGYGACNISDLAPCNETIDSNNCNYPVVPLPSTFSPQACNYCTADVATTILTACDSVTDTQNINQLDNNWDTCCNLTQIVADCPTGLNTSSVNSTQSCSIFDYTEGDLPKAAINTIVKFILGFGALVLVIIVGYLMAWTVKKLFWVGK